jgi:hypothetical protein
MLCPALLCRQAPPRPGLPLQTSPFPCTHLSRSRSSSSSTSGFNASSAALFFATCAAWPAINPPSCSASLALMRSISSVRLPGEESTAGMRRSGGGGWWRGGVKLWWATPPPPHPRGLTQPSQAALQAVVDHPVALITAFMSMLSTASP